MRYSSRLALLAAALLAPCQVLAGTCAQPTPVVFAPNAKVTTIEGNLARGEQACFTLEVHDGRRLTITATDQAGNAVFQLYEPGWRLLDTQGFYTVIGAAFAGAAPGEDARAWTGKLNAQGETLMVIGLARGGGPFEAAIRAE